MTFGLRKCDRLEGAYNFVTWKLRTQLHMEEVNLQKHILKAIIKPTYPVHLATHQKKEAEVKRIIVAYMNDHFISHIVDKKTSKKMFDSLLTYFKTLVLLKTCFCETSLQLFA